MGLIPMSERDLHQPRLRRELVQIEELTYTRVASTAQQSPDLINPG